MLKHKIVLAMTALGVLAAAAASAMADNESFEQRFATYGKINAVRDVDWYAPLEIAKGKPGKPLTMARTPSIEADALTKAADYADARGTVALLVWQGGKLQLAHYAKGYGPASLTDTASMHKSVMAILYGAMLRDGYIKSIDEPAAKYLPEWANDERSKITIHNLMNMASGLENASAGFSMASPTIQLLLSNDIVKADLSRRAAQPPNTEFNYNNANSEALGIILQRATGMRYADYLSAKLLMPIGAGNAKVWLDRRGGMAHTFCCLQLAAPDWLRIGLLLKDSGRAQGHQVIPADWIDRMITPSKRNPNYGLQIWLASPYNPARTYTKDGKIAIPAKAPFAAPDMFFFDGWGAQRVYVSRSADLVIVRLGDATMDWDDSMIPNIILHGMKKP